MTMDSSKLTSVGLLEAQSPWLRKDGVFIGLFLPEAVSSMWAERQPWDAVLSLADGVC